MLPDTAQSFRGTFIHSRVNPVPKLEEERQHYNNVLTSGKVKIFIGQKYTSTTKLQLETT